MNREARNYINSEILRRASTLRYSVASIAPNTEVDLFNSTSLVIWDGASNDTIFGDPSVNWALRALHDDLHLKTRMSFEPASEVVLGRLQASLFESDLMRELIFAEVALQAEYHAATGLFVSNQTEFTTNHLKKVGVI